MKERTGRERPAGRAGVGQAGRVAGPAGAARCGPDTERAARGGVAGGGGAGRYGAGRRGACRCSAVLCGAVQGVPVVPVAPGVRPRRTGVRRVHGRWAPCPVAGAGLYRISGTGSARTRAGAGVQRQQRLRPWPRQGRGQAGHGTPSTSVIGPPSGVLRVGSALIVLNGEACCQSPFCLLASRVAVVLRPVAAGVRAMAGVRHEGIRPCCGPAGVINSRSGRNADGPPQASRTARGCCSVPPRSPAGPALPVPSGPAARPKWRARWPSRRATTPRSPTTPARPVDGGTAAMLPEALRR